MRGAGMAAAYGASLGVLFWASFKAVAWGVDRGLGAWCRRKDNRGKRTA